MLSSTDKKKRSPGEIVNRNRHGEQSCSRGHGSRAVNRIPYKPYVRYHHMGAVPYQWLLSNLTTVTISGW